MALSLLSDFQSAQFLPVTRHDLGSHSRWLPPLINWIKMNSDASLGLIGSAGIEGVLRDHLGVLIKVFSSFLPACDDIEVAEALACRFGLKVAIDLGFKAVAIEIDNQTLARLLHFRCIPKSPIGTLVADILSLSQGLDKVSFVWTRRSCNSLADEVARLARDPFFDCNSLNSIPVSLRRLAAIDAAPDE